MRAIYRSLLSVVLVLISYIFLVNGLEGSRKVRQPAGCDEHWSYLKNKSVAAYCRYYGDRFYECTAWNRLLARNHWILTDGIIPAEMWTNRDQRVRIAECKFYECEVNESKVNEKCQYRCRGSPVCAGMVCERKCPWGGRYEGTAHTGYKQSTSNSNGPASQGAVYIDREG